MKKQDIPGFESSKNLKASDLDGKRVKVTIAAIKLVEFSDEDTGQTKKKPRATFRGREKGLVLNVTNWNRLVELTGSEDSDDWVGREIQLFPAKVDFQGQLVDGIRVYLPEAELSAEDVPF